MTKRILASDVIFCSMGFVVQVQWQRFAKDLWQCLLLTPWLNSPLGALASITDADFSLSTAFCRRLLTFISSRSFSTSSSHLYLGLLLLLLRSTLVSNIFLIALPLSILTTCLCNICHREDAYEHLVLYIYIPSFVLHLSLIPEKVGINKNDVPIRNKR
jgi:hypothetical protein